MQPSSKMTTYEHHCKQSYYSAMSRILDSTYNFNVIVSTCVFVHFNVLSLYRSSSIIYNELLPVIMNALEVEVRHYFKLYNIINDSKPSQSELDEPCDADEPTGKKKWEEDSSDGRGSASPMEDQSGDRVSPCDKGSDDDEEGDADKKKDSVKNVPVDDYEEDDDDEEDEDENSEGTEKPTVGRTPSPECEAEESSDLGGPQMFGQYGRAGEAIRAVHEEVLELRRQAGQAERDKASDDNQQIARQETYEQEEKSYIAKLKTGEVKAIPGSDYDLPQYKCTNPTDGAAGTSTGDSLHYGCSGFSPYSGTAPVFHPSTKSTMEVRARAFVRDHAASGFVASPDEPEEESSDVKPKTSKKKKGQNKKDKKKSVQE